MRNPTALVVPIAIAALLVGCSRIFPLDVILDSQGRVVFASEREWKWFVIPHRPKAELCSIDVYDQDSYVWRLHSPGDCIEDAIPLVYGAEVPGLRTLVRAQPLIPERAYMVRISSWEDGSQLFIAPAPGARKLREARGYFDSPEERRFRELRDQGMPFDQIWPKIEAERNAHASNKATAPPAAAATSAVSP